MKKIVLITVLFLMSTVSIKAQDDSDNREKLQFGLKAGLNYSNVYDEKGEDFVADSKIGFVGGVLIAIPFGKYLGIQPEFLYSQKGFKGNGMILGTKYSFIRTTNYLDIPLQFVFKPINFLSILVGPQFSYLLSQSDVFTSSASSYEQEKEFKQDNIQKNIFGAVAGFDVNIRHITLGTRVSWDLQKNAGDGSSNTPRYKNVCFQGAIGYKFYR